MSSKQVSTYFLIDEDQTTAPIDKTPPWWELLRFDTTDVLYICPMLVTSDKSFGCKNGTKANPLGDLETRFNWAVQTARKQNPKIRIVLLTMMGYDINQCLDALEDPKDQDTYTDSVRDFLATWSNKTYSDGTSGRIDGWDVDYEYYTGSKPLPKGKCQNVQTWTPAILKQLRTKLDALSGTTGVKYQISICPATADYLSDMACVIDLVNMQNYDGGRYADPDYYISRINGLNPSQLVWGTSTEQTIKSVATSVQDTVDKMNATYKGATETGSLFGAWTWRINSNNWVFESMAQIQLYCIVKNLDVPDGLESLVTQGWAMNGGRDDNKQPVAPFLEADWIAHNRWLPSKTSDATSY